MGDFLLTEPATGYKRKAEDMASGPTQSSSSSSGLHGEMHMFPNGGYGGHGGHDGNETEVDDSGNDSEAADDDYYPDDDNLFDDEIDDDFFQKEFATEPALSAPPNGGPPRKQKKRTVNDAAAFELHKLAINTFKEINGHLLVTQTFVIPSDDPQWPQAIWGMKFGQVTNDTLPSCPNLSTP
jgi:hypothetical protein